MRNIFVAICFGLVFNCAYADKFPRLDRALPSNGAINGLEPVFDFDGDGCYPAAGIGRDGRQNPGLKTSGAINGNCHDAGFLNFANTLHRYACLPGSGGTYCAHVYDMYFEKDQAVHGSGLGGHRHDWETVAIWTLNRNITHASYSCHGKMYAKPLSELPMQGRSVKFVYHKDGASTHCFRFAKPNEIAENHYRYWVTPDIVTWYELKGDGVINSDMRGSLNTFDYGSASIKVNDREFLRFLNNWKPSGYPQFTQASVEASQPR
ncbi:NPP1 family protein [Burkholderia ubonensis]|uniref:NPP1 family protein n=1 Tax=Burkholderia ubonensis TaxID=101571 RepID=UPI0009B4C56E|nr:NPP1 family protein [Burkholderia ubonensis]